MIRIQSRRDGFRRCGIAHSKSPAEYSDDRFSKEELEVLQDEPMLIVEVVNNPDDVPGERITKLVVAVGELDGDKNNKEHWTADGLPQLKALEQLSGLKKVTAAERDTAFTMAGQGND